MACGIVGQDQREYYNHNQRNQSGTHALQGKNLLPVAQRTDNDTDPDNPGEDNHNRRKNRVPRQGNSLKPF